MAKDSTSPDLGLIRKRIRRIGEKIHRRFEGREELIALDAGLTMVEKALGDMHGPGRRRPAAAAPVEKAPVSPVSSEKKAEAARKKKTRLARFNAWEAAAKKKAASAK